MKAAVVAAARAESVVAATLALYERSTRARARADRQRNNARARARRRGGRRNCLEKKKKDPMKPIGPVTSSRFTCLPTVPDDQIASLPIKRDAAYFRPACVVRIRARVVHKVSSTKGISPRRPRRTIDNIWRLTS